MSARNNRKLVPNCLKSCGSVDCFQELAGPAEIECPRKYLSRELHVGPLLLLLLYRKIHCLTREFHVKFHAKNRYRTNREAISAISVFHVKFNVEFIRQAVNFS